MTHPTTPKFEQERKEKYLNSKFITCIECTFDKYLIHRGKYSWMKFFLGVPTVFISPTQIRTADFL